MTPQQQAAEDALDAHALKVLTGIVNLPRPIKFRMILAQSFLASIGGRAA